MTHDGYSTRLYYCGTHGIAKLHGRMVVLANCPLGMQGIDYTPEDGVMKILDKFQGKFQGWRDMNPDEVRRADDFLYASQSSMS